MGKKLEAMGFVPLQNEVTYKNLFGNMQVWEADSWQEASLSWKKSSYIHAGISGGCQYIKGPDAQKLLSRISINDVYNWKVNRCKHLVMCDENGLIVNHALTQRNSEEEFCMYAGNPWPIIKELQTGKYNAEIIQDSCFVFQMSGPLSLTIIEKVAGESQRDVRFLDVKHVRIPGIDTDLELCCIGMSGTLAYEFRGPAEFGPEVYQKIWEDGQEYNLKRLGWKTYTVNHTEGGFPQMTVGFETAAVVDPVFMSVPELASVGCQNGQPQPAGGHADIVSTHDGKVVGVSSCTLYSYYYRTLFSQCILDIDQAELGNEVLVHWGDFGKKIKKVRAKVVRYPYTDLVSNQDYDLSTVPSGVPEK